MLNFIKNMKCLISLNHKKSNIIYTIVDFECNEKKMKKIDSQFTSIFGKDSKSLTISIFPFSTE